MDFYIIGAGGLAKEVWWLLKEIKSKKYSFKGFIDYRPRQSSIQLGNKKIDVIDEDLFLKENKRGKKNVALVIAIGNPATIKQAAVKYHGMHFPNLIHPGVAGDFDTMQLGKGNIITAGCILTVNIKMGDFNIINFNTTIGHDNIIGSYNVLNPGCNLSGGCTIGDGNLLGTNSTIMQNLKVGNNSVLAASGWLTKNLGDDTTALGMPARAIWKRK